MLAAIASNIELQIPRLPDKDITVSSVEKTCARRSTYRARIRNRQTGPGLTAIMRATDREATDPLRSSTLKRRGERAIIGGQELGREDRVKLPVGRVR